MLWDYDFRLITGVVVAIAVAMPHEKDAAHQRNEALP